MNDSAEEGASVALRLLDRLKRPVVAEPFEDAADIEEAAVQRFRAIANDRLLRV